MSKDVGEFIDTMIEFEEHAVRFIFEQAAKTNCNKFELLRIFAQHMNTRADILETQSLEKLEVDNE